jgi:hypothetical protein
MSIFPRDLFHKFVEATNGGRGHGPVLGFSGAEAAEILGIRETSVARLVRRGLLHKPSKYARNGLDLARVRGGVRTLRWVRSSTGACSPPSHRRL